MTCLNNASKLKLFAKHSIRMDTPSREKATRQTQEKIVERNKGRSMIWVIHDKDKWWRPKTLRVAKSEENNLRI